MCFVFKSDNNVRILSCNVNGLNSLDKTHAIRRKLLYPIDKSLTPDIYTFQETFSQPSVLEDWDRLLPGHVAFAHGTNHSAGVLLGVHSDSSVTLKSSVQDDKGRFIVAECGVGDESFTVVSMYFNPETTSDELAEMLSIITIRVDYFGHNRVVWVGDVNDILNPDLDTTAIFQSRNKHKQHNAMISFMDTHELTDIWRSMHPFTSRYTVRSRGCHTGVTMSCTDYFLVSPAMLTATIASDILPATRMDKSCLDHNPISYDFVIGDKQKGKGYWKFPDFLLHDTTFTPQLLDNIKQTVRDNVDAEPGLLWHIIKMNVQGCAIDYLAKAKKDRKQRIEKVKLQIREAVVSGDEYANDPYKYMMYEEQANNYKNQLDSIYFDITERFWKNSTARVHFESNHCTKFYFRLPGAKNEAIKYLSNCKGMLMRDQNAILEECQDYYKSLYSPPNYFCDPNTKSKFLSLIPMNNLSESELNNLDKPLNLVELYNALKDMNAATVPGADGLPVNFYLTFWDHIKQYLFDSYLYAFQEGRLSILQRRGLIRLLPKKDKNPLSVASWRPITLLNVDYKILTKLFSKHLALILPKIVHPDQKGFIRGRNIQDNLWDFQSLLALGDDLTTEGMIILLDIQKAFDSIGWSFIRSVLVQYQLPNYFVTWFDIFYMGKELHILNNGLISRGIPASQGSSSRMWDFPSVFCTCSGGFKFSYS